MKTEKMCLSDLRPFTRGYSVYVRVVAKNAPEVIPTAQLLRQIVLLEDEEGNRMRAVLIGDQVDDFKEKMQLNECYEISDAPIVSSETVWKSGPKEVNYQLHLSTDAKIRNLSSLPAIKYIPYRSISEIRAAGATHTYVDVLGIVLYIEAEARTITNASGRMSVIREVVLTDPSSDEPLYLSMMDELARSGCSAIPTSAPDFTVVSFTDMLTSAYKGFSLTTSMVTAVNKYPGGEVPDDMRKWVTENKLVLGNRRNNLLKWLGLPTVRSFESVCNLELKTAKNTQHGECFWLKVIFPSLQLKQINSYVGCSNCEGPTTHCVGTIYTCDFCFGQLCQARMQLSFIGVVADESGAIPVKVFTHHVQKMFRKPVPDILTMVSCRNVLQFDGISERLGSSPLYVRVASGVSESHYPSLVWTVIDVELLEPVIHEDGASPSNTGPKLPDAVVQAVKNYNDAYEAYVNGGSS